MDVGLGMGPVQFAPIREDLLKSSSMRSYASGSGRLEARRPLKTCLEFRALPPSTEAHK